MKEQPGIIESLKILYEGKSPPNSQKEARLSANKEMLSDTSPYNKKKTGYVPHIMKEDKSFFFSYLQDNVIGSEQKEINSANREPFNKELVEKYPAKDTSVAAILPVPPKSIDSSSVSSKSEEKNTKDQKNKQTEAIPPEKHDKQDKSVTSSKSKKKKVKTQKTKSKKRKSRARESTVSQPKKRKYPSKPIVKDRVRTRRYDTSTYKKSETYSDSSNYKEIQNNTEKSPKKASKGWVIETK